MTDVLWKGFIDMQSEWRSGDAEKRGAGADPERTGGVSNALLQGGGLGVGIATNTNSNAKGTVIFIIDKHVSHTNFSS